MNNHILAPVVGRAILQVSLSANLGIVVFIASSILVPFTLVVDNQIHTNCIYQQIVTNISPPTKTFVETVRWTSLFVPFLDALASLEKPFVHLNRSMADSWFLISPLSERHSI